MAGNQEDFEDLLKLFNKHKVKYCIVGAFAVAFHAISRYTKDLDLYVEANFENGKRILKALQEFGFTITNLNPEEFAKEGLIIQLGYEPVRIDVINKIDGCNFKEVWKEKRKGRLGFTSVHYIGIRQLIQNKRAAGRAQDKADLEILKKVKKRS